MGKYTKVERSVFSIFGQNSWKNESINTWPADFVPDTAGAEYVRVNIISNGAGLNKTSVSGILIIDIFTAAGSGPTRQNFIADKLDGYLENKSIPTLAGVTQLQNSALRPLGLDKANTNLSRASYEIPFHFYGVTI
jgi:hypothetical protein